MTLTDSVVNEVLSDLALEVLGQREGAHDPAVPVDDGARHAHALVHHALDRRPGGVYVAVRGDQDGPHEQDRDGELEFLECTAGCDGFGGGMIGISLGIFQTIST